MPLILGTNSIKASGYDVDNSCKFDDGDGSYMHKSQSGGNRRTFTLSCWFKRGNISINNLALFDINEATNPYANVRFDASNKLKIDDYDGDQDTMLITNRSFADCSAWYHLCIAYDTTQSTESNRIKVYVNGTRETSFSTETYPAQNFDTEYNNSGATLRIADFADNGFDGYMSEVVMIDGSQLAPTSFGEFDEDSPTIWKPKDVSGLTFGTNGFYLDFKDSSNLGNDANGGTDFTEVNVAATDQATDTPTNNFCTINPLHNYYTGSTFSEGNCQTVTGASNYYAPDLGTFGLTSGKWFWEIELEADEGGSVYALIGVKSNYMGLGTGSYTGTKAFLGLDPGDYGFYGNSGDIYNGNGTSATDYGNSYSEGQIVGIALNLDDNELKFYINGTVQNSGTAISITAPASTVTGAYYPAVGAWGNGTHGFKCNFGGSPAFTVSSGNADGNGYGNFEYSVPSGFYSLCTKNLAEFG